MPNQISDTCAVKILTKFPTLFEPYVDAQIYSANQAIAILPELKANFTAAIKNITIALDGVTTKIRACNKKQPFQEKLDCAVALVS